MLYLVVSLYDVGFCHLFFYFTLSICAFSDPLHWASSLTRLIRAAEFSQNIEILQRDDNLLTLQTFFSYLLFFFCQFHDEYTQQDIFDSLTSLEPASLPSLSLHSSPGYIYLIEGKSVLFEMNQPTKFATSPPTGLNVATRHLKWRHLKELSFAVWAARKLNDKESFIAGFVTGVDEESACCWLVCDTCENREISTLTSGEMYVLFMFSAVI